MEEIKYKVTDFLSNELIQLSDYFKELLSNKEKNFEHELDNLFEFYNNLSDIDSLKSVSYKDLDSRRKNNKLFEETQSLRRNLLEFTEKKLVISTIQDFLKAKDKLMSDKNLTQLKYCDASFYVGNIKDNKKNGFGYFEEFGKYQFLGFWDNDMHQSGALFYKNKLYFGEFKYNTNIDQYDFSGLLIRATVSQGKKDPSSLLIFFGNINYESKVLDGISVNDDCDSNKYQVFMGIIIDSVKEDENGVLISYSSLKDDYFEFSRGKFSSQSKQKIEFYNVEQLSRIIYDEQSNIENFYAQYLVTNDCLYNGEVVVDKNSKINIGVKGLICFPNNHIYEGRFYDSKKSGEGTYIIRNDNSEILYKYHGEFENDFIKKGTIFKGDEENVIFEGDFENNNPKFGRFVSIGGEIYEGEFTNNQREGKGRINYLNGSNFEGIWKANMKNGKGTYTDSQNNKLNLEFENDEIKLIGDFSPFINKDNIDNEFSILNN